MEKRLDAYEEHPDEHVAALIRQATAETRTLIAEVERLRAVESEWNLAKIGMIEYRSLSGHLHGYGRQVSTFADSEDRSVRGRTL